MGILAKKFGKVGYKGETGESFMYEVLQNEYEVSDYRKDLVMQTQGIDFGIKLPNWRREYTLDVKNNLYIEPSFYAFKIELEDKGKPGWFFTSKADRIYHSNAYMGEYFYYELTEMRHFVNKKLLANDYSSFTKVDYKGDILLQFRIFGPDHGLPISNLFKR